MATNLSSLIKELLLHLPDTSGVMTALSTTEASVPDSSRVLQLKVYPDTGLTATGTDLMVIVADANLAGKSLVRAEVFLSTAAIGATLTNVGVKNKTTGFEMLSTNITVAASATYSANGVINPARKTVSLGDLISVHVDAIGNTTAGKGLGVVLTFA